MADAPILAPTNVYTSAKTAEATIDPATQHAAARGATAPRARGSSSDVRPRAMRPRPLRVQTQLMFRIPQGVKHCRRQRRQRLPLRPRPLLSALRGHRHHHDQLPKKSANRERCISSRAPHREGTASVHSLYGQDGSASTSTSSTQISWAPRRPISSGTICGTDSSNGCELENSISFGLAPRARRFHEQEKDLQDRVP